MTLRIDHLRLRLPQGFETRGNAISRHIRAELACQEWLHSISIERLRLQPIQVSPQDGDVAIAKKVVAAIAQDIERRLP